jgi:hypothetical protein
VWRHHFLVDQQLYSRCNRVTQLKPQINKDPKKRRYLCKL